jgi:hypothetical protein
LLVLLPVMSRTTLLILASGTERMVYLDLLRWAVKLHDLGGCPSGGDQVLAISSATNGTAAIMPRYAPIWRQISPKSALIQSANKGVHFYDISWWKALPAPSAETKTWPGCMPD